MYEYNDGAVKHEFPTDETLKEYLKHQVKNGMRKGEAILRYVDASNKGRRFSDIQRFICEMNGRDYDKRSATIYTVDYSESSDDRSGWGVRDIEIGNTATVYHVINGYLFFISRGSVTRVGKILRTREGPRTNRGYGCTWLLGSWRRTGILERNCFKDKGMGNLWFVEPLARHRLSRGIKFPITKNKF